MRPVLKLLTDQQANQIFEDALRTLSKVGVYIENEAAMALLLEGGVRVEENRAHFTEEHVRRALSTVPAEIPLYDREGKRVISLGGDEICFDPGSAALYILDAESGRRRQPTTSDCVHLAWVTEACRHVEAQATGVIPADVPQQMADWSRLYIALHHCRKPVVTGTFPKGAFGLMKDLLAAVRGGEEALRQKPLAIFDCAPTPPLKWSDLTCQALVDCARAGIPAELVSMPMAGATSPVTLREVVVQHCAENLSGIVIHQLAHPGAPILYGGSPSALDMRHGTTPMGAIETMMIDVAYAQMGKHLKVPTHAYMGLSDAKTADYQAGLESGLGAVLAALAGINVISGPGMLDFEVCQSLEKLVLDNEACGMARRLVRGIGEASEIDVVDLLGAVVREGHFLANPHTRSHFRKELFIPGPTVERASYGDWERRGAHSSFEAARAEVQKILAKGNPAPLSDTLHQELHKLAAVEARRCGLEDLPSS
jgi:trimethylamine---corrinoid protein Co-methyltransferase